MCGDLGFYTLSKFGCVPWGPVLLQQLFSDAVSTEKCACHWVCRNLFRVQQDRASTRKVVIRPYKALKAFIGPLRPL